MERLFIRPIQLSGSLQRVFDVFDFFKEPLLRQKQQKKDRYNNEYVECPQCCHRKNSACHQEKFNFFFYLSQHQQMSFLVPTFQPWLPWPFQGTPAGAEGERKNKAMPQQDYSESRKFILLFADPTSLISLLLIERKRFPPRHVFNVKFTFLKRRKGKGHRFLP